MLLRMFCLHRRVEREPMWDGNEYRELFFGIRVSVEREPMWDGNGLYSQGRTVNATG